jgi:hypothetical protein
VLHRIIRHAAQFPQCGCDERRVLHVVVADHCIPARAAAEVSATSNEEQVVFTIMSWNDVVLPNFSKA